MLPVAITAACLGGPALAGSVERRSDDSMPPALAEAVGQVLLDERYEVASGPDGTWQAANPAQGMSASFSPEAFEVSGEGEDGEPWTLGLRLESWGRGSLLTPVTEGSLVANGRRMEIRREGLVEWYVNDERGFEQGFTITAAPGSTESGGPLRLTLAIDGDFTAEVLATERDARLTATDGNVTLSYTGLRAWDAEGRDLDTRLVLNDAGLAILVDDEGARYPLTIDPWIWTEEAKLTASDAAAYDQFGQSVSISGETALVGAPQSGDAGAWTGSVYVFVRSGTVWSEQAKLLASDAEQYSSFGSFVSLSGDVALIGAPQASSGSYDCGAAYVFVRTGTVWSEQAKISPSDPANGDMFGVSVSLSVGGDMALVGAQWDDDGGTNSGSAYVFTRTGSTWSQQAKLTAGDPGSQDRFGWSVSLSGETALIASRDDDSGGTDSGSVYVFVRTGTVWTQQAKLTASDPGTNDRFGWSVALVGDLALVGAPGWTSGGSAGPGATYAFSRTGTTWSQQAKLTPSDTVDDDLFGWGVSLSGDTASISSVTRAAYVFTRTGSAWYEEARFTSSDHSWQDMFGTSISISGDTTLVGASADDHAGPATGSAYAFRRSGPDATCQWYCGTGANAPTDGFVITSPAVLGGTFSASVTGCAVGNWAAFLVGYSGPLTLPSPWGEVLVDIADPNGELLGMPSGVGTPAVIDVLVPNDPRFCGFVFYTQAASFVGSLCLHCGYECTVGF